MFIITIKTVRKADFIAYLERYFDDADGDNYARLIRYCPQLLEDYIERRYRNN